jgi:hypothetical protein
MRKDRRIQAGPVVFPNCSPITFHPAKEAGWAFPQGRYGRASRSSELPHDDVAFPKVGQLVVKFIANLAGIEHPLLISSGQVSDQGEFHRPDYLAPRIT